MPGNSHCGYQPLVVAFAERGSLPAAGFVRSLRFDAREFDHLGPLLGFVRDEFGEFNG